MIIEKIRLYMIIFDNDIFNQAALKIFKKIFDWLLYDN